MKTSKEQFLEAIEKTGGLRSAKMGNTLFIYSGDLAVNVDAEMVKKAIRSGEAIIKGGVKVMYDWQEQIDSDRMGASGSQRYIWHKDGNRIRCSLVERRIEKDGSVSSRVIKTAWKSFSEL